MRSRIATPEHSLGFLKKIMNKPEETLSIRHQTMRLDWKGVRVDDQPG